MTDHVAISKAVDTFGDRVKTARKEAHLTIATVAQLVGVDPRTVAGWQVNRSKPSYERLLVLARVLNKPPSYFLGEGE